MMQNPCHSRTRLQIKNPCIPLSNQKSQNLGKLRKIHHPFSDSHHRKWNSQNLQQIAQNLLNLPTVGANHTKFAQFASISQGSLYPRAKLPKLAAIRALGKLRKFCRPFSDSHHGKWNSQNLQQIAQNLLNLPTVGANHAKFVQFASISQGSLYPRAKLPKLAAIRALGKLRKFRRPFSDSHQGKWNSQNLQQIAQNLLNLPTVGANHAKFVQFASISQLPKFTANSTKSAQFACCHCKSRKIRAICVNFPRFSVPTSKIAKISGNSRFGQITQISPAIFRFRPRKMELSKFTANCAKSAQFAHCHRKSRKICAICVNFPTQNLQQIAQNLLNLPTVTANHAKFAQFASISQGSLYPWVELSNFAIFMYLCNFVDFSF